MINKITYGKGNAILGIAFLINFSEIGIPSKLSKTVMYEWKINQKLHELNSLIRPMKNIMLKPTLKYHLGLSYCLLHCC